MTQEPYYTDYPVPMEYLPVNKGWGQGYGYILYRTHIPSSASQVTIHELKDFGIVRIQFIYLSFLNASELYHYNFSAVIIMIGKIGLICQIIKHTPNKFLLSMILKR